MAGVPETQYLIDGLPSLCRSARRPLGRIWAQTVGSAGARLLFDGDELSTSYTSAGAINFRVVPSGLGVDSPLVWFSGSGVTSPTWLHTDALGSVVAQSDSSGDASPATPYGYDPYGAPDTTNGFGGPPLKYTGQMSLSSLNLYDYKARDYDPNLGRFLQTDPAGYASDVNPYAYAANDPLSVVDSSGRGWLPNSTGQTLGVAAAAPDDRQPLIRPASRATFSRKGRREPLRRRNRCVGVGVQKPTPCQSAL
jgi:RHS repeat-associated protein